MADAAVLDELAEVSRLLQGKADELSLQKAELEQREATLAQASAQLNQQQHRILQRAEELGVRLQEQQASTTASQVNHLESECKRRQLLITQLRHRSQALERQLAEAQAEGQTQAVTNRRLKGRLEALQTWKQETMVKMRQLQQDNQALLANVDIGAIQGAVPPCRLDASLNSISSAATGGTYICSSQPQPSRFHQAMGIAIVVLQHLPPKARSRCCQSLCTPASVKELCQLQVDVWDLPDDELRHRYASALCPVTCETLVRLQSSALSASCRSSLKLLAVRCQPVLESSAAEDCAPLDLIPKLVVLALVTTSGRWVNFTPPSHPGRLCLTRALLLSSRPRRTCCQPSIHTRASFASKS